MKKVLISFDGNHYSTGAFEFARQLNEQEPILLTGVFLAPADFTTPLSYAYSASAVYIPLVENRDPAQLTDTINRFEAQCLDNGINYRIHQDLSTYALQGLKKESRFADLMIIGGEQF